MARMSENSQPSRADLWRSVIADAAVAVVFSLFVTLVLASLSAAGVITMTLAIILLVAAWTTGLVGSFVCGPIWNPGHKDRLLFLVILAASLSLIGIFEYRSQPLPSVYGAIKLW